MKKRVLGIDIIKVLAIYLVFCIHYLSSNNFYAMPLNNIGAFIYNTLRYFILLAVPLFLMVTGYLQCKKEITKEYYMKLINILIVYLLACVTIIIFRHFYYGENMSIITAILSITNFSVTGYSWYINMFIGLYLIIPFLNIILNKINKKEYYVLVIVLLLCISLPYTLNSLSRLFVPFDVLPNWWGHTYPLIFYIIGAGIKLNFIQLKKKQCLILGTLSLIAMNILSYIGYMKGQNLLFLNDNQNLFGVILCCTLFIMLKDIDIKNTIIRKIIIVVSPLTLYMLLYSSVIDKMVYGLDIF
ncbi:MAG: acyltransferase family protein, partial [Erysipelotrichaceae bacterium]